VTKTEVLLAIIAAGTVATAVVQVGLIVAALRFAKRMTAAVDRIEDATRPLLARFDDVALEAIRSLAAARDQMNRLERMTADVVGRIDQTVRLAQTCLLVPARQGVALLAGARAMMQVFRRLPFAR
jgi:hypothetical protein